MLICLRCALSGRLVPLGAHTFGPDLVQRPYTLYRCWVCFNMTCVWTSDA